MLIEQGANVFTDSELEAILNGEKQQETPPASTEEQPQEQDVTKTKAFANRLKESTDKARKEEREAIAKELGYASYQEMQTKRQNKIFEDQGLDPDQVSPIVEKLVQERMENDPRIKELEKYREAQIQEFGRKELAEITKLTNGEVTTFEQIPKDVLDLWKQNGSLKASYLQLHGEELVLKARSEQNKGGTSHLKSPSGNPGNPDTHAKRALTDKEKRLYKMFNPSVTDEEINKKLVDV